MTWVPQPRSSNVKLDRSNVDGIVAVSTTSAAGEVASGTPGGGFTVPGPRFSKWTS